MKMMNALLKFIVPSAIAVAASGCTGQLLDSFRLAQQQQTFSSQLNINTKIDLLFVVDSSGSMGSVQDKLRQGFVGFASKYMQPTWDIRVAVITTDTYLANAAFQSWIQSAAFSSSTVGFSTSYLTTNKGLFDNTKTSRSGCTTMLDSSTGDFNCNLLYKDLVPVWGSTYAQLLPGLHDGPITGLCFEPMAYFFSGPADCKDRDFSSTDRDISSCLNAPDSATAIKECVNTAQNNTVRSGKGVIQTMPASTLTGAALTQWNQDLLDDFRVNITAGTVGVGSSRGFGSVLQLLSDNEISSNPSSQRLFRAGSLRGIIFISDSDDQTMNIPSSPPAGFSPWTGYQCDKATLDAMNTGNSAYTNYCCTGASCQFQPATGGCPALSINGTQVLTSGSPHIADGSNFVISLCPTGLTSVSSVQTQLNTFFQTLDSSGSSGNPNYFIASIVPQDAATVVSMQQARYTSDANLSQIITNSVQPGTRYIQLGTAVGNGSLTLDLNASDYSPLLNSIGDTIIQQKSTYALSRAPTALEDMFVEWIHGTGGTEIIPSSKYTISGKNIVITDTSLVLSFAAGDSILINYQPKSQF